MLFSGFNELVRLVHVVVFVLLDILFNSSLFPSLFFFHLEFSELPHLILLCNILVVYLILIFIFYCLFLIFVFYLSFKNSLQCTMYTIRVYHTYVSGYIFRGKVKRKLSESIPHFYNLFVSLSYKCLFQGGHSLFSLNFSQFLSSSMFSFTKSILLCIRSIYKQSIESNSPTRYLSSFYVHLSFVNVVFV